MGALQRLKDFFIRLWQRHKSAIRDIVFDGIDEAYLEIEVEAFVQADRLLARAGITDEIIKAIVHDAIHRALEFAKARVKKELDEHVFDAIV